MWKNSTWILNQDNAPAHETISIQQFLAKTISVLEHPPDRPDPAPCDFFFYSRGSSLG